MPQVLGERWSNETEASFGALVQPVFVDWWTVEFLNALTERGVQSLSQVAARYRRCPAPQDALREYDDAQRASEEVDSWAI